MDRVTKVRFRNALRGVLAATIFKDDINKCPVIIEKYNYIENGGNDIIDTTRFMFVRSREIVKQNFEDMVIMSDFVEYKQTLKVLTGSVYGETSFFVVDKRTHTRYNIKDTVGFHYLIDLLFYEVCNGKQTGEQAHA